MDKRLKNTNACRKLTRAACVIAALASTPVQADEADAVDWALAASAYSAAGAIEVPDYVDAGAAFEKLLSLAGDWQIAGPSAHGLLIRFYTTARGSVLVEEWTMQGRPHSLTVYHRDGDTLLATHYCPQGNQPRLALYGDPSGAIRFALRDITDYDPSEEQYQHDLWFAVDDPDHITRSEIYKDGDDGNHPTTLKLERVKGRSTQ